MCRHWRAFIEEDLVEIEQGISKDQLPEWSSVPASKDGVRWEFRRSGSLEFRRPTGRRGRASGSRRRALLRGFAVRLPKHGVFPDRAGMGHLSAIRANFSPRSKVRRTKRTLAMSPCPGTGVELTRGSHCFGSRAISAIFRSFPYSEHLNFVQVQIFGAGKSITGPIGLVARGGLLPEGGQLRRPKTAFRRAGRRAARTSRQQKEVPQ